MPYTSPNHDARPAGAEISVLVLHYTGMESAEAALTRLCDPEAKVSAHYVVDEDGTTHVLVEESARAWHAGKSNWRGYEGVNDISIGIELVNPGHEFGYRPFPEAQMQALITLCQQILARHPIPPRNVVAHADIAPDRKEDPGELFEWRRLAQQGIGLWAEGDMKPPERMFQPEASSEEVRHLQHKLSDYGYPLPITGVYDAQTISVIKAFQRHFSAGRYTINGIWDTGLDAILSRLLASVI